MGAIQQGNLQSKTLEQQAVRDRQQAAADEADFRARQSRALAQRYPHFFSRKEAEVVVNEVFKAMTEALRKGERIELRGFGSFIVKERAARQARNPQTGTVVYIPAKHVPVFKVGKELRWRVDGKPSPEKK